LLDVRATIHQANALDAALDKIPGRGFANATARAGHQRDLTFNFHADPLPARGTGEETGRLDVCCCSQEVPGAWPAGGQTPDTTLSPLSSSFVLLQVGLSV